MGMILALFTTLVLVLAACTSGGLGSSSSGWSPGTASDGIVYVGTKQGEVKALEDGGFESLRVKWTFCAQWKTSAQVECDQDLGGVFDSPVLGPDLVYVSGVDGNLYGLDKETGTIGEKGWKRQVGALEPLIAGPAVGTDSSGRSVVVVGSEDGNLYAFDASPRNLGSSDGDPLLWVFPTGDKIWSTPVIKDGVAYFGSHNHKVYAISLDDGTQEWSYATGGVVAGRPLLFNNLVVAGSFDKKLYAIDADTGVLAWQIEADNWFWGGAVANDRTIFAPSMDGNIYAVDGNGGLLWKHDVGAPIVSRPVLVPRGLAVAGKNGKISLLSTNRERLASGREISFLFLRDTEVKAPLSASEDAIFVGAQDSTVIRINMSNVREVWCFDTDTPGSAVEFRDIRC